MSRRYTDEQDQFLKEYIPGHHYREIIEEFNKRFPDNLLDNVRLANYSKYYNLSTGLSGQFKKGHKAFTKGKKQKDYMSPEAYERSKSTRFKTGHEAFNYKEIGSEYYSDGYVFVKIAEPDIWQLKSRYVWKQHNGEIPEDCVILHKNGIKDDDRIENLELMNRSELINLNMSGLFFKNELEINEAAIAYAKLKAKIGKVNEQIHKRTD